VELDSATIQRILGEFEDVDLGDPRRTRRVLALLEKLAKHPSQSLPRLLETESALEGTYRLLNNEHFDFDDLLQQHREMTIARALQAGEVLVLHDTSTCSFEHADPKEVGYLPTGKAGFFAHVGLVVDAAGHRRPLGVLHVEPLWRNKRSGRGSRGKHLSGHELKRWEGRESERWARGVQVCQEQLEGCSVVHVMDREGDKYELLAHMHEHDERFVIRSKHDRRLTAEYGGQSLRQTARVQPVVLQREVHLSRRIASSAPRSARVAPARQARPATLNVMATSVVLRRPNYLGTDFPAALTVNVVHVQESEPPNGEAPIEWTLLTSEPIDSPEQVASIVDKYRYRWLIEELFKAFKTGCQYEKRQFESRHALLNLMAISLPIAVELLWMRAHVDADPQAPAERIITEQQIEVLRAMGHRPLPDRPTAQQVLFAIAGLGGHLKRNGSPGWHVLYRGYERLLDYEAGWAAAQTAATRPAKRRKL